MSVRVDVAQLEQLSRKLLQNRAWVASVMPKLAPILLARAKASASAGTTPDGQAWAPKKRGSGKPLANAASALTVRTSGTTIFLSLGFPELLHQRGTSRLPARRILPTDNAWPREWVEAVKRGLVDAWKERMR